MIKRKSLPVLILIFAFTLGLAFFLPAVTAHAAEDAQITVINYESNPEAFTTSGGGATLDSFTLPSGVTGYYKVEVPEGVVTIKADSFNDKNSGWITDQMVSVVLPNTVATVEAHAFVNCKMLAEVCAVNAEINVHEYSGLYDNALSRVSARGDLSYHAVTDNGSTYYFVREGDKTSTIWALVAYEGEAEAVALPAPEKVAEGYTACTSYAVKESVCENGSLTSLTVPAGVTEIGDRAFLNCFDLTSVTVPKGLVRIGNDAFNGTKITSLSVPATVTEIGTQAFYGCFALGNLEFAERNTALTVGEYAFYRCTGLTALRLPELIEVHQYAFADCIGLDWVSVGSGTTFVNVGAQDGAVFFPSTVSAIIFSSAANYNAAISGDDEAFKNAHGDAATYIVNVNFYVGAETEPLVYERLMGKTFNYAYDEAAGDWMTSAAYDALPAQSGNYASTVWYGERELTNKVSKADVDELLQEGGDISLYCYETVWAPVFPSEPATWVVSGDKSYDVSDVKAVLGAMGCTQEFTAAQLGALKINVVYADADGKVAQTPAAINQAGTYSISVLLNPDYGVWNIPAASTVTVNVNTTTFTIVMIVVLIVVAVAVGVTVSTVLVRRRVLARAKKKQISSQEAIERYRAAGGKTNLK